jgi:hypothetical protein
MDRAKSVLELTLRDKNRCIMRSGKEKSKEGDEEEK